MQMYLCVVMFVNIVYMYTLLFYKYTEAAIFAHYILGLCFLLCSDIQWLCFYCLCSQYESADQMKTMNSLSSS